MRAYSFVLSNLLSHMINLIFNSRSVKMFCLICGLMSQSTTMVMLRQSVNLTTHFLSRLIPKWLTST